MSAWEKAEGHIWSRKQLDTLCMTCGHRFGRHDAGAPHQCLASVSRGRCDCEKFVWYECIYPKLPTAEEMYESLRRTQ